MDNGGAAFVATSCCSIANCGIPPQQIYQVGMKRPWSIQTTKRQSKVGWSALHREEPWRLHNLAARLKTSPNSSLVSAFSTLFVILLFLHYHALEISQSEDFLSS